MTTNNELLKVVEKEIDYLTELEIVRGVDPGEVDTELLDAHPKLSIASDLWAATVLKELGKGEGAGNALNVIEDKLKEVHPDTVEAFREAYADLGSAPMSERYMRLRILKGLLLSKKPIC